MCKINNLLALLKILFNYRRISCNFFLILTQKKCAKKIGQTCFDLDEITNEQNNLIVQILWEIRYRILVIFHLI